MKRVYFVDLDGVIVLPGWPPIPIPGAVDKLLKLSEKGEIWLFSCWGLAEAQIAFLNSLGVPFKGFIPKPLADEYVVIDDHLKIEECSVSL